MTKCENDVYTKVTEMIKARIESNHGKMPISWLYKFKENTYQKIFKNKRALDDLDVKTLLFAFVNR
jgi:hypothetical protein